MEILVQNNNSYFFNIEGENVKPEDLSRDNLLWLLNEIYHLSTKEDIIFPGDSIICEIKNPIEREIVQQILQKVSEFKNNVDNIRREIESQFPEIN
ncbi:hypothetical protein NHG25_05010 [Aerococcaceae bacterium NML191292]|nr:hypothetical protein [Aerococcaceae bacterium NML191292]